MYIAISWYRKRVTTVKRKKKKPRRKTVIYSRMKRWCIYKTYYFVWHVMRYTCLRGENSKMWMEKQDKKKHEEDKYVFVIRVWLIWQVSLHNLLILFLFPWIYFDAFLWNDYGVYVFFMFLFFNSWIVIISWYP